MNITIICNRYKPQNPQYVLDARSMAEISLPDGLSLEQLLAELGVSDKSGKVFRVNRKAVFDYETKLQDGDRVEIFQMFAAG